VLLGGGGDGGGDGGDGGGDGGDADRDGGAGGGGVSAAAEAAPAAATEAATSSDSGGGGGGRHSAAAGLLGLAHALAPAALDVLAPELARDAALRMVRDALRQEKEDAAEDGLLGGWTSGLVASAAAAAAARDADGGALEAVLAQQLEELLLLPSDGGGGVVEHVLSAAVECAAQARVAQLLDAGDAGVVEAFAEAIRLGCCGGGGGDWAARTLQAAAQGLLADSEGEPADRAARALHDEAVMTDAARRRRLGVPPPSRR
jgi:hypothetical protein